MSLTEWLVTFDNFDFSLAVSEKQRLRKKAVDGIPAQKTRWNDNEPRVARSKDGVALLYSLPNFLTRNNHVSVP